MRIISRLIIYLDQLKIAYLIGNPEIPIHYTSLSQVEQALLHSLRTEAVEDRLVTFNQIKGS